MTDVRRTLHDVSGTHDFDRTVLLFVHPRPDVTIRTCPSGCMCHALRAPGSNVTTAPATRPGATAANGVSTRTSPVKFVAGPFAAAFDPFRTIATLRLRASGDVVDGAQSVEHPRISDER